MGLRKQLKISLAIVVSAAVTLAILEFGNSTMSYRMEAFLKNGKEEFLSGNLKQAEKWFLRASMIDGRNREAGDLLEDVRQCLVLRGKNHRCVSQLNAHY